MTTRSDALLKAGNVVLRRWELAGVAGGLSKLRYSELFFRVHNHEHA